MKFKILSVIVCACFWVLITSFWTPPAWALIQIQLQDLSYKDCPPELAEGAISSGSSDDAYCFIVMGKANNTTGKVVVDADIFGRIYDANSNSVMPNRGRLGNIDTVPPGISDFEFRISIPSNLELPLQLKQFKAAGFSHRIGR
ncbi:conserved exported hypothetical protein [Planktothrix serta PCC 8927]|uniref:Biotin carboxylase n=1 Tax=Planktothrix serta PCC 8927 TaxID=671068 RepID=A0A7Z9E4X2_9CYAN|nr:hypothetical protein [Planktothrix serta]VXD25761.1 conserved exported hypothetical protein [Planktothrix serta PCC 8927]